MKASVVYTSLALLAAVVLGGDARIGVACYNDSQCESSCCSNDRDYDVEGVCEDIDGNVRCTDRETRDKIVLTCLIFAFFTCTAVCLFMKYIERQKYEMELRALKIRCATDENEQLKKLEKG